MTKKLNKAAKTTLAAALVASAIVPVASASANTTAPITNVVVNVDGVQYDLAKGVFDSAVGLGSVSASSISHIKVGEKYYTKNLFSQYIGTGLTPAEALVALTTSGKEEAITPTPGKFENGQLVGDESATELKVVSVSAINKTKLTVVLNTAVDSVSSSNFKIEGVSVTAATLGEDKKTVTLTVSGLEYGKEYTVVASDISVDGKASDFGSAKVTIPAVTDAYNLVITATDTEVTADGADNTVITFTLLDKLTGEVADADDMVLEIGTTFGNLANTRVTLQDGVGKVVLTSEYSAKDVTSRISAQIIETSIDFTELKGKVNGETTLSFVTVKAASADQVTLVKAESNQADRVVLYFDQEVSPATFAKLNKDGSFATDTTLSGIEYQLPASNGYSINIEQAGESKQVVGFKSVAGNSKAIEVILDASEYLTDNAEVVVNTRFGSKTDTNKFTLTDPRQAEVTSVVAEGITTLKVKFSEAVKEGNFTIDGLLEGGTEFDVEIGEFDPKTGLDERDTATLTLNTYAATDADYVDATTTPVGDQRYFKPGKHSLTVTQLKDFAGMSDGANISSTQTLDFTVLEDATVPTVKATVESPEQIRLSVDKNTNTAAGIVETAVKNGLKVKDSKGTEVTATWVTDLKDAITATKYGNEYVVELTEDWKDILPTPNDSYTNYTFTIDFDENVVKNEANGKGNAKTTLNLSYAGSALTKFDNLSPVISTISSYEDVSKLVKVPGISTQNLFVITMDEPVKLRIGTFDTELPAGNTVDATVEFQAKDKDGKDVVISGVINSYADKNGADKKFFVTSDTYNGKTLQEAVNAGELKESFTVVVKSIADDVGNTAATLTKEFKIEKETATDLFEIVTPENGIAYGDGVIAYDYDKTDSNADSIEITFTSGVVNNGGDSDLTKASNWTLNGKALTDVASIKVKDTDTSKEGFETVVITFVDSNVLKASSNVITVNKNVVSAAGVKLTGEFEVVAKTINATATAALAQAISGANTALGTVSAATTAYTNAGGLVTDTEYTDVEAAETALDALVTAGTDTAAIVAATTVLTNAVDALDAATTVLTNAAGALAQAILDANNALGTVSTSTTAYTAKGGLATDAVYTDVEAAETALDALVTAGTDTAAIVAATTALTNAVDALDAATALLP